MPPILSVRYMARLCIYEGYTGCWICLNRATLYCITFGQRIYQKAFLNWCVNTYLFSKIFNRFWPVEKCGATPYCLYHDLLTLKIPQNTWICLNDAEYAWICLNIPEQTEFWICQNSECAWCSTLPKGTFISYVWT